MSKLTRKDKIEIYKRKLEGETTSSLSKSFNVRPSNIDYLIQLIRRHGYDILRNGKNRFYSNELLKDIKRDYSRTMAYGDIGITNTGFKPENTSISARLGFSIYGK